MTMTTITLSDRQRARLHDESVIWFTTVNPSGTPVPTPVWFLWSSDEFLIFSQPATAKLANISANPRVALNFNGTADGGDVAVFTATAVVDEAGPGPAEWDGYIAKYAAAFPGIEMTPEEFIAGYSVLIRATPERVRGW